MYKSVMIQTHICITKLGGKTVFLNVLLNLDTEQREMNLEKPGK